MTSEPEDPLAERLFDAARRERPRAAARTRTAQAVSARRSVWSFSWPKLAVAASLALLSGLVVTLRRESAPAPSISAELPLLGPSRSEDQASRTRAPNRAPASAAVPPSASAAMPVGPVPTASVKPRPITQQEELAVLDRARELLATGDAASALAALERYERTPSARSLGAEAALLRIQALAANGRTTEASALAQRFVTRYPNSPLVDRARSFAGRAEAPDASTPGTEP